MILTSVLDLERGGKNNHDPVLYMTMRVKGRIAMNLGNLVEGDKQPLFKPASMDVHKP